MLTFTPCIRTSRAGRTQLKIRASVNNTTAYIDTPFYIDPEILADGGEITDKRIRQRVDAFIDAIWRKLEGYDLVVITAKEVKDIANGNADRGISFPRYARDYIIKREREGLKRWDGYDDAVKHLSKFMGKKDYTFGDLSVRTLQAWLDTLRGTKRISVVYPMFIKKIWTSAMRAYNDPDRGVFRIKEFPGEYLLKPAPAPSASRTQAQALSSDEVYGFATADLGAGGVYAHAVAMLSFCLAGINVADLYDLTPDALKDGKICYYRAKTRGKRTDDAYMEVTVHERAKPYLALLMEGAAPGKLLSLSARYRDRREVPNYLRKSLLALSGRCGLKPCTVYTFRYSFASIAVNECGVPLEEVAFALNHATAHRVTVGYIKKDFSRVDRVVEAVLDKVFDRGVTASATLPQ